MLGLRTGSMSSSQPSTSSHGSSLVPFPHPPPPPHGVAANSSNNLPREPSPSLSSLELKLFPPLAEFIGFGGASKHVITNCGSHRLVFKVKCSNNALFKVAPVYSFLDPGMSMDLQVVRLEGPIRKDKLLIMFKEAKIGERDARIAFEAEGVTGKTILPLITREIDEYPP
ncbi:unnamed protein product, partial [Mesorhabditis belari]|uniref:Major sperm protein n=1 Tax=Mesorhabditis belari TaxID=2138241 RepID=A0AAF3EAS6_9BILA